MSDFDYEVMIDRILWWFVANACPKKFKPDFIISVKKMLPVFTLTQENGVRNVYMKYGIKQWWYREGRQLNQEALESMTNQLVWNNCDCQL